MGFLSKRQYLDFSFFEQCTSLNFFHFPDVTPQYLGKVVRSWIETPNE